MLATCQMQHDPHYTTHITADKSYGKVYIRHQTTGYSRASQHANDSLHFSLGQQRVGMLIHADPDIGCIV